MKANRKFVEKEAGVSAVIGVILMVAITVAIAATVFVYVNQLASTSGGSGKTISAVYDSKGGSAGSYYVIFKVTSTDVGIPWLEVTASWRNTSGVAINDADGVAITGDIEVGQYFRIDVDYAGTYDIDLIYNENIIWTCPTVSVS